MVQTKHDYSIDLVKFFAVFLIINSHMDALYPKYSLLATGGSIGDTLFLFCSGFTLFLGREMRFDSWYKRRINRIYPSVLVCTIVGCLFTCNQNLTLLTLAGGGGEFVIAIMLYYIVLYYIRKYAIDKIAFIFGTVALISLLVYIYFFPYKTEVSSKGIYGVSTLYRWIPYFLFMLMGAWCGLKRNNIKFKLWSDLTLFIISLILFYAIQFAAKKNVFIAPYQIVTLIPLMGIIFYFYKLCNNRLLISLMEKNLFYTIVMTISGLCLESYLIQFKLFTTSMNGIFPFNLPIMILIVLMVSFLCKVLSRFVSQTFSDSDYDYKAMIKLY